MKTELDTRALLNVKEMCEYLGIGRIGKQENCFPIRPMVSR